MNRLSIFKLSRHFFVVFLLITVLPLCGLLWWSDYNLKHNMQIRQTHLLNLVAQDVESMYQDYLSKESVNLDRLVKALSKNSSQSKTDFPELLDTRTVWLVNSPQGKAFLNKHANVLPLTQKLVPHTHCDYVVFGKKLSTACIVPILSGERLLVVKPVSMDALTPDGPFLVDVFSGKGTAKDSMLYTSLVPFSPMMKEPGSFEMHFISNDPPGFPPPKDGGPRHFEKHLIFRGPPEEMPPVGPGFGHFEKHRHGDHGPRHLFISHREMGHPGERSPKHVVMGFHDKHLGPRVPCKEDRLPCSDIKPFLKKRFPLQGITGTTIATVQLKTWLMPPHSKHQSNNQWLGALILLAGILSSLLAGGYLQRNFIKPLARLSLVAEQIHAGQSDARVDVKDVKQGDIRKTLEEVNAMLDRLNEKEQLRHSFISNLTHDFRTPLIAQTRTLELLSKEFQQLGLGEQEKLADGILKNNEHLLTMVNQLLEIYQTEAGMFTLSLQPEDISGLVEQAFEQVSPLAQDRNIQLSKTFSPDFPDVSVDAHYLKRVFINLLANAIDNIPKGSHIEAIGQKVSDTTVEIRIRDNGPGIPEELQYKLFDRYYAGSGYTRKLGSGLGLYICAVLVAAHQGTIRAESAEGKGTDFIIQLPLQREEDPT